MGFLSAFPSWRRGRATWAVPSGLLPDVRSDLGNLAEAVRGRLLERGFSFQGAPQDRLLLREQVSEVLAEAGVVLSPSKRNALLSQVADALLGLDALEGLLRDPEVDEIMVNGPGSVWVERRGKLEPGGVALSRDQLWRLVEKLVGPAGVRVDALRPWADGRLPDGSRFHVALPPIAPGGPAVCIRKFRSTRWSLPGLVEVGFLPKEVAEGLVEAVKGGMSLLISGGTSTGKTTLLAALADVIGGRERIVTVEESPELRLAQPNVVSLVARPPSVDGAGEVTLRDLVRNALRMRPDRIIVGEVRGPEAFDMLQALNTGHEGSMCTLHANGPEDALGRLENLALMAGVPVPPRALRDQVARAFQLVVHLKRGPEGERFVSSVRRVVRRGPGRVDLEPEYEAVVPRLGKGEPGGPPGQGTSGRVGEGREGSRWG